MKNGQARGEGQAERTLIDVYIHILYTIYTVVYIYIILPISILVSSYCMKATYKVPLGGLMAIHDVLLRQYDSAPQPPSGPSGCGACCVRLFFVAEPYNIVVVSTQRNVEGSSRQRRQAPKGIRRVVVLCCKSKRKVEGR